MTKNNLKVSNLVMSGRIPLTRGISHADYGKLMQRCVWDEILISENLAPRYSKKFFIREKKEFSVRHKEKAPYVTLFHLGGIIIVGLRTKQEGNQVYDLVIKDLKRISRSLLK